MSSSNCVGGRKGIANGGSVGNVEQRGPTLSKKTPPHILLLLCESWACKRVLISHISMHRLGAVLIFIIRSLNIFSVSFDSHHASCKLKK